MNTNIPDIQIIKPKSGFNFRLPKLHPAILVTGTLLIAVASVVSALLLYSRRDQPIAPTAPITAPAATTLAIPLANSTQWTIVNSATLTSTEITTRADSAVSGVQTAETLTGDFLAIARVAANPTSANGEAVLAFNDISLRWTKTSPNVSFIWLSQGSRPNTIPNNAIQLTSTLDYVNLRLQRVDGLIQAFYFTPTSTGYFLVDSLTNTDNGNLKFLGQTSSFVFTNINVQANLLGLPNLTPTPGSATACMLSFVVLDSASTPLPPTITPSPTSPTTTITPSPTPLIACGGTCTADAACGNGMICWNNRCRNPSCTDSTNCTCSQTTPSLNSCGGACSSNANCQSGLMCYNGMCRNQQCVTADNCTCTITETVVIDRRTVTPTPLRLAESGSVLGTWTVAIGGLVLLGLGGILLLGL